MLIFAAIGTSKLLTMKKLLYAFSFILLAFAAMPAHAGEGDTTIVRAHDATHLPWYGAYDNTVWFPTQGQTFAKVLMVYTMGCPSQGCSGWDYTTQVEIEPNATSGVSSGGPVELARIITPYGGYYNGLWEHPYYFDVTPYAPLLQDSVNVKLFYGGWEDGFTVTIDFIFIEGTPPANTIDIVQLYRSGMGGFLYGDASDPIEDHLHDTILSVPAGAQYVEMRNAFSGHGFGNTGGGNPENCAEFCEKHYDVRINNDWVTQQDVWNDDCGMNALYHQSGTWIYNRAGWCPGEPTTIYRHNITEDVTPGVQNSFNLDMEPYVYTGGSGFPINYIVDAHLLFMGGPNVVNDATIDDVLAPSDNPNYARFNPICKGAQIVLRNTGSDPLTSCTIAYGARGASDPQIHTWTGNLAFGESTTVSLPSNTWQLFNEATDNKWEATILEVNGQSDENSVGNTYRSTYETVPEFPSEFMLWWGTNGVPQETDWYIEDFNGNKVIEMGNRAASTTYRDTFQLDPGCYRFVLSDSDCDGLNFLNNGNGDGVGFARMHTTDGTLTLLRTFEADFGCELHQQFTVGYTVGTGKVIKNAEVSVYPNPANQLLNVDVMVPQAANVQVDIFTATGQRVLQKNQPSATSQNIQLELNELPAGIYLVRVLVNDEVSTHRIVIE